MGRPPISRMNMEMDRIWREGRQRANRPRFPNRRPTLISKRSVSFSCAGQSDSAIIKWRVRDPRGANLPRTAFVICGCSRVRNNASMAVVSTMARHLYSLGVQIVFQCLQTRANENRDRVDNFMSGNGRACSGYEEYCGDKALVTSGKAQANSTIYS